MMTTAIKPGLVRVLALAFAGALGGCSWFGSGDPPRPVSPLPELSSPAQGSVVWSRDTGEGSGSFRLQPALSGGRIYVADTSGKTAAMDAVGGNAIWSTDLDTEIGGGVGLADGLVVVGTEEGEVIALDQSSGAERWRAQLSSEILAAPAGSSGVVVARTNDGKVVGLEAAAGGQIWTYDYEVPVLSLRGTAAPVVAGNQVICGLDGGKLVSLELASGQLLWDLPVSFPTGRTDLERVVDIDGTPLVAGNGVFVATFQGELAAVDLTTGKRAWSRPFSSYNGFGSDATTLYATDDLGYVWALDPASGETRWTQKALSGRRLSAPAAVGGWLAVGDLEGYVHWIEPSTGEIAGRARVGDSPIRSQPVVADGVLYVLGSEGELAALRAPAR